MASWRQIEAEAPELASAAKAFFDAHTHKTIATLRRDGSPRITGTEVQFADGEVWLGSMWQSAKALDLLRDPRFSLHSASEDPPDWKGDARISGRMEEVNDEPARQARLGSEAAPGKAHLFRADITEVVVVRVGEPADHLVIETWRPGQGVRRRERR